MQHNADILAHLLSNSSPNVTVLTKHSLTQENKKKHKNWRILITVIGGFSRKNRIKWGPYKSRVHKAGTGKTGSLYPITVKESVDKEQLKYYQEQSKYHQVKI